MLFPGFMLILVFSYYSKRLRLLGIAKYKKLGLSVSALSIGDSYDELYGWYSEKSVLLQNPGVY